MGHKRRNGHKGKRTNEEFPTAPTAAERQFEFPDRHEVSRFHTESFPCARDFGVSDEENAPRSFPRGKKRGVPRAKMGIMGINRHIGQGGHAPPSKEHGFPEGKSRPLPFPRPQLTPFAPPMTAHRLRTTGFPTAQARHGSPCGNGLCGEENWAWHFSECARQYAKPRIFFLTQPSAFEQDDGCEALIGCSLVLRHEVR